MRHQALISLKIISHSNIDVVKPYVADTILPKVYVATLVREDLIRDVNFGPFIQKVDDGLPLRKNAFLCIENILDGSPERLENDNLFEALTRGISDDSDIQRLSFSILYKIADKYPSLIINRIDRISNQILKEIKKLLKAKKNDSTDKSSTSLRVILRTIVKINDLDGIDACEQFASLYSRIKKTTSLNSMLQNRDEVKE